MSKLDDLINDIRDIKSEITNFRLDASKLLAVHSEQIKTNRSNISVLFAKIGTNRTLIVSGFCGLTAIIAILKFLF